MSSREVDYGRPTAATGILSRLLPVADGEAALSLSQKALRLGTADAMDGGVVFADASTALELGLIQPEALPRRVIFGPLPPGIVVPAGVDCAESTSLFGHSEFFVLVSPTVSFALLGGPGGAASGQGPYGGWTVARADVLCLAEGLRVASGVPADLPGFTAPRGDLRTLENFAMGLMSVHSQRMATARPGAGVNKDDLFSVLDILKAISAKRRAHDILFVFVEEIARILKVDRCSIVRVWGGDTKGHVLASHEDERIRDIVISLDKYPELRLALDMRERVVIADTRHDPVTREFAAELDSAGIRSLVVIPIVLFDPNVGSLFLRAARRRGEFTPREVSFCEIVAEAASNALERAHLFEQIQRTNERLEFLAVTDGLTGLYNHRYFRKRLQEEFDRAMRYDLPLSCLIFDVDNFKRINDTYGHLQGDSILREMALRVTRMTRKSDVVARYGGEEFTVILTQTGLEGAKCEAERLHRELSSLPYQGMPEGQAVTVSIGVAALDPDTMMDSEALLRTADSALYTAKHQGKNRVVVGPVEGEGS